MMAENQVTSPPVPIVSPMHPRVWPDAPVNCPECQAVGVPFAAEDGGYRFPRHATIGGPRPSGSPCPGSMAGVQR